MCRFTAKLPPLKRLFTTLLALGVVAGSLGRLVAQDPCDSLPQHSTVEHVDEHGCCEPPCTPCPGPEHDPSHDEKCPADHHHHVGCCHVMPLVAESHAKLSSGRTPVSRLLLSFEEATAPETPVFELDKPPLI